MKQFIIIGLMSIFSTSAMAQVASNLAAKPDPNKKLYTVETSCGECNFGLKGESCDVAIKLNGKAYFVDGVSIKEYGGPHDDGGFCVSVHKAQVQGEIVKGRFKATYFNRLEEDQDRKKNK